MTLLSLGLNSFDHFTRDTETLLLGTNKEHGDKEGCEAGNESGIEADTVPARVLSDGRCKGGPRQAPAEGRGVDEPEDCVESRVREPGGHCGHTGWPGGSQESSCDSFILKPNIFGN